jgi:cyclohexyl-isocyanide hydratase
MNRRDVARTLAGAAFVPAILASAAGVAQPVNRDPSRPKIAMLVYPDMILLDLVGPQTVFSLAMADIHLVWKTRAPVTTDVGLAVAATTTFADCPRDLDVLFVPGGLKGSVALMGDEEVLTFLDDRARNAKYVTSVCTGALVLAAAGLLKGYRATSHWYVRDLLGLLGATVVPDRLVVDRSRVTGGGVTAGLDFALTLAALLRDEDFARRIQLILEYDPKPPFDAGAPERNGSIAEDIRHRRAPLLEAAREAALRAGRRLPL